MRPETSIRHLVRQDTLRQGVIQVLHVAMLFTSVGAACWAYMTESWVVLIASTLFTAHMMHARLAAFHEAAHFNLHPNKHVNNLLAHIVGNCAVLPLTAYRKVHGMHHAHLGTEADPEMWPFCDTSKSRTFRRLCAFSEMVFGFFYTPILYAASLHKVRLTQLEKRQVATEYTMIVIHWRVVIGLVTHYGILDIFLVSWIIPQMLAGSLQTINKFTEHMGLFSDDPLLATRTVIDSTRLGRVLSWTMLWLEYHGTHHIYAKVPHINLPTATAALVERRDALVYPTYWAAFAEMLGTLADPRAGTDWLSRDEVKKDM